MWDTINDVLVKNMKSVIISILIPAVFLVACQKAAVQPVQTANARSNDAAPNKTQITEEKTVEQLDVFDGRLTPTSIQNCLEKVSVGEPFEFDLSMNPFYLRMHLYGDHGVDYVMVIRGKETKKLGLLICKNAKEPLVLGELAKSKTPLTDMENDNFIGAYWDVATKEEFRDLYSNNHNEDYKKLANAKGEILVFSYEIDGVLYIYWDGKAFRTYGE